MSQLYYKEVYDKERAYKAEGGEQCRPSHLF